MTLAEHLHHQSQSEEPTKNNERVCLSNNIASWQSANNNSNSSDNKTIKESAVAHRQPDNQQQITEFDNDDDDDEDSFTYPSSDDDEDSENKHNWVDKRLPEIPQPSVNNQVTGSNKVNISNTNKNVYEGNVVIHQTIFNNLADGTALDVGQINAASTKKITIDKDPEAAIGPRLSNVSSHPLYPFSQDKVASWCTKKRLIVISGVVLAGIAIISVIVYLSTSGTKTLTYVPSPPNDTSITNVPTFDDVRIVPRVEWLAQPASEDAKPLAVLPAELVIMIPVKSNKCFTQSQCSQDVRELQRRDMEVLKMTDIAYNWLVGGDGLVYHCRGWDVEGDHTNNYNNKSIGIGFIGIYDYERPSPAQIQKGKQLIEDGVKEKHISKDYILVGQYQCTNSSESSAEYLYNITMSWDHWSPTCA